MRNYHVEIHGNGALGDVRGQEDRAKPDKLFTNDGSLRFEKSRVPVPSLCDRASGVRIFRGKEKKVSRGIMGENGTLLMGGKKGRLSD